MQDFREGIESEFTSARKIKLTRRRGIVLLRRKRKDSELRFGSVFENTFLGAYALRNDLPLPIAEERARISNYTPIVRHGAPAREIDSFLEGDR